MAGVAGGRCQMAEGRWQVTAIAGGRWHLAGGRWQVAGGSFIVFHEERASNFLQSDLVTHIDFLQGGYQTILHFLGP